VASLSSSSPDDPRRLINDRMGKSTDGLLLSRRLSSNIGWGPPTAPRMEGRPPLSHWFSRTYTRLLSRHEVDTQSIKTTTAPPLWKIIFASLKLLGLAGFWLGDNMAFLIQSGFLFPRNEKERKLAGSSWQKFAAKCYFSGALAGLYVNAREVLNSFARLQQHIDTNDDGNENESQTDSLYRAMKEKHFKLVLALLKSCCDVTVFTNIAGVDLHQRYRGKKMNEGFQCICALVSASTVLYNNFPNAPSSK